MFLGPLFGQTITLLSQLHPDEPLGIEEQKKVLTGDFGG